MSPFSHTKSVRFQNAHRIWPFLTTSFYTSDLSSYISCLDSLEQSPEWSLCVNISPPNPILCSKTFSSSPFQSSCKVLSNGCPSSTWSRFLWSRGPDLQLFGMVHTAPATLAPLLFLENASAWEIPSLYLSGSLPVLLQVFPPMPCS